MPLLAAFRAACLRDFFAGDGMRTREHLRDRALQPGHLGVELAQQRVLQVDYLDEMGPTQLCRQCLHYFKLRESFSKADHVEQIAAAKSSPVLQLRESLMASTTLLL